jgi:hypothetical protein
VRLVRPKHHDYFVLRACACLKAASFPGWSSAIAGREPWGQDQGARRKRCRDIVDDDQHRYCPQYRDAQRVPAALGTRPIVFSPRAAGKLRSLSPRLSVTIRVCEEIPYTLCCTSPSPLARRSRRGLGPKAQPYRVECEERATTPAGLHMLFLHRP